MSVIACFLFIVRVAGNVISPDVMGSLEYAGAHLRTPLFVALGHDGCGAIKAALRTKLEGHEHRSRSQTLVNNILPGLSDVSSQVSVEERSDASIQITIFVVLGTFDGDFCGQTFIRHLVHPDAIRNRCCTGH